MAKRRRRKALPQGLFDAQVTALSHDGRGIAHLDGKVTFIDGALVDEKVRFEYSFQRKQFDEGLAVEIENPSPDRVQPPCEHANLCGGCSLQHMNSKAQIQLKQDTLIQQFKHIAGLDLKEVFPPLSAGTTGYRRKARLGVKHVEKKGKVLVGFREKRNNFLADINACEVLVPEVGHRLDKLAELIINLEAKNQIPQIEIAKGDDEVCALVFRHLQVLSDEDLEKIKSFCREHQFHLYLQAKGPESVVRVALDGDEGSEMRLYYDLPQWGLRYAFHPNDFTQVNGEMNRLMINRVMELMAPESRDTILDLFCGLGNFSLPLAKHCGTLIGVEGSEEMVRRAEENAATNGIDNARFHALNLEQDLNALKANSASWVNVPFNKMLIDPPRSGALSVVENIHLFNKLQLLVYVSCNPATLARDAAVLLKKGFRLQGAGIMDMFPHTNHVESLAVFVKGK